MKARNILLSSLLCLLFSGPALIGLASWGGVSLPSWLTAADAAYLSGGITEGDPAAHFSVEGFASGEFQEAAEDAVGNCVPLKAAALLVNAAVQRSAIEASNVLFGWGCYPTFYGSSIMKDPREGRFLEMAEKATAEVLEEQRSVASGLSAFCETYPQVRFFVYLGPDSRNVVGSPSAELTSNPLLFDHMESIFGDSAHSFQWVSGDVTYEEYLKGWNGTDHHWNIIGALQAYDRIAGAMGLPSGSLGSWDIIAYDEPLFRGTFSRRGLDSSYADVVLDYCIGDATNFTVVADAEGKPSEFLVHRQDYENREWGENPFFNRYAEYFHTDYGLIEISNEETAASRELLIVSDSYSNCIERLFADHYAKTYVLDPRYNQENLAEFLDSHEEIADVLFLMRAPNMWSWDTQRALGLK